MYRDFENGQRSIEMLSCDQAFVTVAQEYATEVIRAAQEKGRIEPKAGVVGFRVAGKYRPEELGGLQEHDWGCWKSRPELLRVLEKHGRVLNGHRARCLRG
ncbi:hypothetical protein L3X38_005339 [Prunus dulcis]|uniref:Uncharacterized protein n=1 Tax=Prunus dulcis TaxID=3755 RepID=A0AAD4ZQJ2_PRUDU|nr:hypothetical protein L3X38_005339 [Prunus dulcis]